MDCKKLIAAVKRHPTLWDKSNKCHYDRDFIQQNWKEVAHELKENEQKIRLKWRGLRDTFRREIQKCTARGDDKLLSKWAYFNEMMFLKDDFLSTILKKKNIEREDKTEAFASTEESPKEPTPMKRRKVKRQQIEREDKMEALTSTEESQKETTPIKKKVKRNYAMEGIFLHENEKPVALTEKSDLQTHDDDYYFAMSIIPYMRKVPPGRKLQLRTKIQQLILEEQQRLAFSPSPISRCSSIESVISSFSVQIKADTFDEDDNDE